MNNSPYQKYLDSIRNEMQNGKKRGDFNKSQYRNFTGHGKALSGISELDSHYDQKKDESLFESLNPLKDLSGKKVKYHERPGSHPDFQHIKTGARVEHHYITSMFIDIKNSTGLFKKYLPLTVANITTTIQRAAIHTCWYFDGYVQRFNGDGLMVYFGGKKTSIANSVNNAISASSFFSYFMKNDLKKLFFEQGVEDIYTRIGIDTGENETVLWHLAGMGDCSEITTCSLHTSLAPKMQSFAPSNGIMIGDNVKENSNCSDELFSIKWNEKDNKEERYIFQIPEENFNYTQWQFNWEKYLKNHPLIKMNSDGELCSTDFQTASPIILHDKKNLGYLKEQVQDYRPYMS